MRKKLDAVDKRGSLIGVKVKQELKDKIQFISEREVRTMSTQIQIILEDFVNNYFEKYDIDWKEYAPRNNNERSN